MLRAGLIDLRLVAEYVAGRLFSKRRRGRHKAVRRLLRRHRDARRRQSLDGGRSILGVEQETDGHPHGGSQHRHLQPQRPSPGKAHPPIRRCSSVLPLCARCDYRHLRPALRLSCFSCGLEMSCYLSNILSSPLQSSHRPTRRMTSKGPDQFLLSTRSRTLIKRLSRERRSMRETALPFHE